jgi:hypothetical protein
MNTPLTYTPAYLGLFASLWLALVCNSFLDIQYGGFTFEAIFWALMYGWTLRVAWLQRGQPSDYGKRKQKIVLFIGLAIFVLVFLPRWGMPRAGLYLLGMLQAAQNCVTTTRRQLHLGLLVSAVMVMFAASHYRADWTMLFYLLPYIVAVVFTLVSEQISRRAQSIRDSSLQDTGRAGQGMAIGAATFIILGIAGVLYLATPQVTWPYLHSQFGQVGNGARVGGSSGAGAAADQRQDEAATPGSSSEQGKDGEGAGEEAAANPSPWRGWPTPGQMREAAGRPGMPGWQATAIGELADLSEAIARAWAPVSNRIEKLLKDLAEWLQQNKPLLVASLFVLMLVALLVALMVLFREAKTRTWIRTRFDYWYLVSLRRHASGLDGANQFYRAMERLFALADAPRSRVANTREFLRDATHFRDNMRPAATELTLIFERLRYGASTPAAEEIVRMSVLYQELYRSQAN